MMPWNSEQQRLLQAMGYTLYVRPPVHVATTPAVAVATTAAPDYRRLLQSLQLALPGRDISALVADLGALRRDAGSKRALWPTLRALRRPH